MIGSFQPGTAPALEQTILFAERRHELLAGNLANLDTPGYRARDLNVGDFQNALAEAIDHDRRPPPTDAIGATLRNPRTSMPRAADQPIVMHDGGDVTLEEQVTEISKNKSLHALAITTLRSQYATLRAAITERA